MANIILVVAFVIEVAFAAYCILTKSNQRRIRNFVRIGALAAFVLFSLVSIIQWSFRWFGLALLLSVWAILGAWGLISKKVEEVLPLLESIISTALPEPKSRATPKTGACAIELLN